MTNKSPSHILIYTVVSLTRSNSKPKALVAQQLPRVIRNPSLLHNTSHTEKQIRARLRTEEIFHAVLYGFPSENVRLWDHVVKPY